METDHQHSYLFITTNQSINKLPALTPAKNKLERKRERASELTEGDVEDEERVGVGDVRRARLTEVRHGSCTVSEREIGKLEIWNLELGLGFVVGMI